MADNRIVSSVTLSDSTTPSQRLAVDSSGRASVSVETALPAGTNNIGDVDVASMPATAVEDAAASGGETGVYILGVRNDSATARTSADGDFGSIALDSAGRVGIADLGGSITVDGTVAVSGTVTVDSELPAAAALDDAVSNPTSPIVGAAALVYNGSSWDRMRGDTTNGLDVDVTRVSGTVTVDSELPSAAALADGASNPTTPTVGAASLMYNGTTWDRMRGDTTNGLAVDVTRVSGTVTVDSELPAAAALADAAANPTVPAVGGYLMGFNGTTWDRVRTANTGRLQVDVLSGGGETTPTGVVLVHTTKSALSAGSATTTEHRTSDLSAGTYYLAGTDITSSVPFKGVIQAVVNDSATTIATIFGKAGDTVQWRPADRRYASVTSAAAGGFDGFQVIVTNLDTNDAADTYANFMYQTN